MSEQKLLGLLLHIHISCDVTRDSILGTGEGINVAFELWAKCTTI